MTIDTVSRLLMARRADSPTALLGIAEAPMALGDAVDSAASRAHALLARGLVPGEPVALVGENSNDWLLTWMACQLAGLPTALINPSFPDELMSEVLTPLAPQAVLSTDARPAPPSVADGWIDARGLIGGTGGTAALPGLRAEGSDLSAFMLTWGTTGPPKLVAQSQRYFVSLGRYIADGLGLTGRDTVLTPLPLFHINPLGYGVLGSLSARASCLSLPRFLGALVLVAGPGYRCHRRDPARAAAGDPQAPHDIGRRGGARVARGVLRGSRVPDLVRRPARSLRLRVD
ncbi:AMP-binding protein [Pseudonocardia xishanensis]|uniref:AMP-dependent synthetase/ligase domain-containing protein n=1 Tax=Pseudonocardia xishanensis TaxID=630995 RepID=A0ABP8RJN8_9PSEU